VWVPPSILVSLQPTGAKVRPPGLSFHRLDMPVGLYYFDSPFNWRLAQLLQIIPPIMVLCGLPFMVESPRWLVYHGHSEKALGVFKQLHYNKDDPEVRFLWPSLPDS
jgi:hypothetical protein